MTSASAMGSAQLKLLTGDLAIAALRRYPTRIKSAEEAMKLKGVGEKTARKVDDSASLGLLWGRGAFVYRLFLTATDHGDHSDGRSDADKVREYGRYQGH